MSEFDGARFRMGLRNAPDRNYLKLKSEKSDYVEEHIMVPIMAGNEVDLRKIDFNAFELCHVTPEYMTKIYETSASRWGQAMNRMLQSVPAQPMIRKAFF